ncbi:MAG: tetratricopeptide repeat protein [Pseudomonadota bacterium]
MNRPPITFCFMLLFPGIVLAGPTPDPVNPDFNPYDEKEKKGKPSHEKQPAEKTDGGGRAEDEKLKKEQAAELHFLRGVEFFDDGMISAALAEFLKSYKDAPAWEVLYNVGVCFYRLGRYDEALEVLERYAEDGGLDIPADRKVAVEKLKAKMAATYGNIIIDYRLPGLKITIDSKKTYDTPVAQPIPVSAGIHSITMFREGHYPAVFEVPVASGEDVVLPVKMDMMPLMEAWMTETGRSADPAREKKIKDLKIATWTFFSLSLALGVSAVAAGAVTYKIKEEQDVELIECEMPITSYEDCPDAFDLKDRGEKWKDATNGLLISVGATFAVTLALWIAEMAVRKKSADEETGAGETELAAHVGVPGPGALKITW